MIKRLLKSVREFKKDALLTPFFVVLEVVMEVVIPAVMALLIDRGIDAHDRVRFGIRYHPDHLRGAGRWFSGAAAGRPSPQRPASAGRDRGCPPVRSG